MSTFHNEHEPNPPAGRAGLLQLVADAKQYRVQLQKRLVTLDEPTLRWGLYAGEMCEPQDAAYLLNFSRLEMAKMIECSTMCGHARLSRSLQGSGPSR